MLNCQQLSSYFPVTLELNLNSKYLLDFFCLNKQTTVLYLCLRHREVIFLCANPSSLC